MSRIRSVKPDFWASEKVMALPRDARLMFIGIWNFSDDAGRFKWAPATLRAQIFPGDLDVTVSMVEDWLCLLVQCGLIERYVNGQGVSHAYVLGWDHQKINRPQPPKYPDPKECQVIHWPFSEHAVSVPCELMDGSDRIGRDLRGEGAAAAPTRAHPPARALARTYVMQASVEPGGTAAAAAAAAAVSPADEFSESDMRATFADVYFSRRKAPANMRGNVTALHAEVHATAEARGVDAYELFRAAVHRWAAGDLNDRERKHPYACFAAAWGDVVGETSKSLDPRSELLRKSTEALKRGDMAAYNAFESELSQLIASEEQQSAQ